MEFNNSTNNNGLVQDYEFWAGLTGQLTDGSALLKEYTRNANAWYDKVVTMILNAMDDADYNDTNSTTMPPAMANLEANQATYTLPDGTLQLKRVEITYDGVTWKKAEKLDINQIGTATDTTTIASNFSVHKPYYDLIGDTYTFYPTPSQDVTGGIKLWVIKSVDLFVSTDTTKEPGFDRAFHRMLSLGPALDYAIAKGLDKKNDIAAVLKSYEDLFSNHFGRKASDNNITLQAASVNYE